MIVLSRKVIGKKVFWHDGFLHLPGFFPPAEVMRWRQAALARGKTLADLLSDAVLSEIVLEPRIHELAREILGGDPVYFGDSTAAIGYNGWGFHKDNSDRLDGSAPDWQTDRYPLIRFAVYCQDHDPAPGGIEFRRGSHMVPDYETGEYVAPKIRVGDLLVWNFRTSHSAGTRKLKLLGTQIPHREWIYRLDRRLGLERFMQQASETRVGLFLTFAKEDPLLDRHIEYLKQRVYPWKMWEASHWSDDVRRKPAKLDLSLIDLTRLEYDGRRVHEEYHPLGAQFAQGAGADIIA